MMTRAPSIADHRTIHLLAARAECDVRTVRRALTDGLNAIRVGSIRERLAREMRGLRVLVDVETHDGDTIELRGDALATPRTDADGDARAIDVPTRDPGRVWLRLRDAAAGAWVYTGYCTDGGLDLVRVLPMPEAT